MNRNNRAAVLCTIILIGVLTGCKDRFLDVIRDRSTVVPNSLTDLGLLLDHTAIMNRSSSYELAVIGSDEYSVTDAEWQLLAFPEQKNGYIWAEDTYGPSDGHDWSYAYLRILYANQVMDELEKMGKNNENEGEWKELRGRALFFRAFSFYQLAQLFCRPYDEQSADSDLGIPLRLEADITIKSRRGSLRETYGQIAKDLRESIPLLSTLKNQYTPSRESAYALLSRLYLQKEDYTRAALYADTLLMLKDDLVDFASINASLRYTFPLYGEGNPEVLFYHSVDGLYIVGARSCNMDAHLLGMYGDGDLRRSVYFHNNPDGRILFKGNYTGSALCFSGLSTNEVLLIRAEANARLGRVAEANDDVKRLLSKRITDYEHTDVMDREVLLGNILDERRRELVMRGTRWEDLRRLNKDPRYARSVVRNVNGTRYELAPNDDRWVWPIPRQEVLLNGIQQNSR